MKNMITNLKNYIQIIVATITCFVMGIVCETPKVKLISEYIVKDTKTRKTGTDLHLDEKKNAGKSKIIYWNEPRIQNRINKSVYFNTG